MEDILVDRQDNYRHLQPKISILRVVNSLPPSAICINTCLKLQTLSTLQDSSKYLHALRLLTVDASSRVPTIRPTKS